MHGNAANVAIILVLAVLTVSGEAKARLRPAVAAAVPPAAPLVTPAAHAAPVAKTPPAVALAAPVAPVAKDSAEAEQSVVRKALAATGKTYEALHTQAAGGRIEGPGTGSRAEQAQQIIAQLHPVKEKAAIVPQPKQVKSAESDWPSMPRRGELQLNAELLDAEAQIKNKLRELSVQTRLEKEKEEAAAQAQKRAIELREKAKKLRTEADLAAQIAKEKSDAAVKAENGMKRTVVKAQKILEEEKVMQRFLNQTKKEELALEKNVTSLKIEEATAAKAAASVAVKTLPKKLSVKSAASTSKVSAPMDHEDMKQLVEENNRLKHEKAVLEQQLSDRKVAKEKAKLKQKLKNRLALADRHMKLQKRMLRTGTKGHY